MLHGRRHSGIIFHRTHAGIEIEDLAQSNVERANAASDGRCQRAFNGDTKFADGGDGVIREPVLKTSFGLLSGKNFVPNDGALAVIRLFDCGVEHTSGGFPDIATGTVALNEGNNRVIGNAVLAIAIFDLLPVRWDGDSVERRHATCLQKLERNQSL